MALDTFVLVAAQYDNEEDALADYAAVKAVYKELDIIDTYDAAVVSKDADGKVKIVKRHEQPTRDAAKGGLGLGLAGGAGKFQAGIASKAAGTSRAASRTRAGSMPPAS